VAVLVVLNQAQVVLLEELAVQAVLVVAHLEQQEQELHHPFKASLVVLAIKVTQLVAVVALVQ
jgi:hypothetical protein